MTNLTQSKPQSKPLLFSWTNTQKSISFHNKKKNGNFYRSFYTRKGSKNRGAFHELRSFVNYNQGSRRPACLPFLPRPQQQTSRRAFLLLFRLLSNSIVFLTTGSSQGEENQKVVPGAIIVTNMEALFKVNNLPPHSVSLRSIPNAFRLFNITHARPLR